MHATAHAAQITPSNTAALPSATKNISFVSTGTQVLVIDTVGGETEVSIVLPSGMYPIQAKKVYATSTVTDIVGYWD